MKSKKLLCFTLLLCLPMITVAQGALSGHPSFVTHGNCVACHNSLETSTGEDVSIGTAWSATMMANSARDPYWQAAIRRETLDHPESSAAIQNECSTCHMPMAHIVANEDNRQADVFAHLPFNTVNRPVGASEESMLAEDGVSCSLCHQITPEGLGTEETLVGRFHIDIPSSPATQRVFGPFEIDTGRQSIMHSAAGYTPGQGTHIQSSDLCGSCHTLITEALGAGGSHIGELFEQMPYQEWEHSDYAGKQTCQDCHMPVVEEATRIASVLGPAREGLKRHTFVGGNFFILDILNRYRDELAVTASSGAMQASVDRTISHLQSGAAGKIAISNIDVSGNMLTADINVSNSAGHKLPTAYPSRRVWIHLQVRDSNGNTVFESGRFNRDGSITGNDNDADPAIYEPHYRVINEPNQVQIYESIIAGQDGALTTGLLTATQYLKDNRVLPLGFDKGTADEEISTKGSAETDADFTAGSDSIRYQVNVTGRQGPFTVDAELWYQPISHRWAENLAGYDSFETNRFTRYYRDMSDESAIIMASTRSDSTP